LFADQRQLIVNPGGISYLNRYIYFLRSMRTITGGSPSSLVDPSGNRVEVPLQKLSRKTVGRSFAEREIYRDRQGDAERFQESQLGLRQVVRPIVPETVETTKKRRSGYKIGDERGQVIRRSHTQRGTAVPQRGI